MDAVGGYSFANFIYGMVRLIAIWYFSGRICKWCWRLVVNYWPGSMYDFSSSAGLCMDLVCLYITVSFYFTSVVYERHTLYHARTLRSIIRHLQQPRIKKFSLTTKPYMNLQPTREPPGWAHSPTWVLIISMVSAISVAIHTYRYVTRDLTIAKNGKEWSIEVFRHVGCFSYRVPRPWKVGEGLKNACIYY